MFNVRSKNDRLNYGDILMPPRGYVLDKAIGTTYSLDLETLTSAAISLGLTEETDSDLMQNPICILNAIRKISDKILIFSEAGQIKLPTANTALSLLLEKMVVPVSLSYDESKKKYPSFHAKSWLLAYQDDDCHKRYRFIIMSRNLTFDRSWDVAAVLDGSKEEKADGSTVPLIEFLNFLKSQLIPDHQNYAAGIFLIEDLMADLSSVSFSTRDKSFSEFQIMPLGIGANQYNMSQDPMWTEPFDEMLIMSPFLSDNVIKHYNDTKMGSDSQVRTLITRRSELEKLSSDKAGRFKIYVVKDRIYDGEDELYDEGQKNQKQDIHAKLYLRRKIPDVDLYLGSMNASYKAMSQNVELMIRLRTNAWHLTTKRLLEDLFGGDEDAKENPFESVELTDQQPKAESDETDILEMEIKWLCRAHGHAMVSEINGKYDVQIHFCPKERSCDLNISPLRCPEKKSPVKENVLFEGLDLLELSEFYRVEAVSRDKSIKTGIERVIMIPTENIPAERDRAVVQSVIKDRESFMEYIIFTLGDNHLLDMMESLDIKSQNDKKGISQTMPAVYERMLKAAADNPDNLKEIDSLLNMITDKEIVPDEFRDMYDTFKSALGQK